MRGGGGAKSSFGLAEQALWPGPGGDPGTKPLPWRLWAEPGEGVAGTRLVEQGGAGGGRDFASCGLGTGTQLSPAPAIIGGLPA